MAVRVLPLTDGGSWPLLTLGVVVALGIHSFMYGPQAAFIAEQFSPRLRYTGSSLAYTLAGVIGGAVAPLVFTALLDAYDSWVPLALYVALTAVVTVTGLCLGRDGDDSESDSDSDSGDTVEGAPAKSSLEAPATTTN